MTERFTMDSPNDWGFPITDNVTGKVYSCDSNMMMKDLCKVVNGIVEENEQLKSENIELTVDNKELKCANNELYQENEQLKQRNENQYNQLKQLWELIEKEDYNTLRSMLNQMETDEKLLQSEWRTYCD